MAAIICPGVVRYSINGQFNAGRPFANILDMHIDHVSPTGSREEDILEEAGHIIDGWVNHMRQRLSSIAVWTDVSWVDLNSADGVTGSTTQGNTLTFPAAGLAAGDMVAGNTAVFIRKEINAGRGSRNGRMYLPGVPEANQNAGLLTTTALNGMRTDLANFVDEINHDATTHNYVAEACVVHRTGAQTVINGVTYDLAERNDITTWVLEQQLATQRRRLRK